MNGVSSEDSDSSCENRTRFLDLLGVVGGVGMHPDILFSLETMQNRHGGVYVLPESMCIYFAIAFAV
jgi:hypothetical protein